MRPHVCERRADQALALVLVADVARHRDRLVAGGLQLGERLVACFGLAARDHDLGAGQRHLLDDGAADAAGGSGDDGDFAGQAEELHGVRVS